MKANWVRNIKRIIIIVSGIFLAITAGLILGDLIGKSGSVGVRTWIYFVIAILFTGFSMIILANDLYGKIIK